MSQRVLSRALTKRGVGGWWVGRPAVIRGSTCQAEGPVDVLAAASWAYFCHLFPFQAPISVVLSQQNPWRQGHQAEHPLRQVLGHLPGSDATWQMAKGNW